MTAAALTNNITPLTSPFDSGKVHSVVPTPTQMAQGFTDNVDIILAGAQSYLHNATTSWVYLAQLLGLALPFNPVAGASIVATPAGGVVSLKDSVSGATQFYVALNNRAIGYTDPSNDPTNWAMINYAALAKLTALYADATGTADALLASYPNVPYPVLLDGFRVTVNVITPNLTTTPTLAVTLNGSPLTARVIWKYAGQTVVPIAIGDLAGNCIFDYDLPNTRWVLINPLSDKWQAGDIKIFAGTTIPAGFLQLPTTQTNISRTTYAALFAAIGTTWGVGDGATTFGLPWLPADYTFLQSNANIGTSIVGVLLNHTHTSPVAFAGNNAASGAAQGTASTGNTTTNGQTPAGGAANLAAGVRFNLCIKY